MSSMPPLNRYHSFAYVLILTMIANLVSCKDDTSNTTHISTSSDVSYDSHVHIMSPYLVSYWKELGIPFSNPPSHYSNIDTILSKIHATQVDLISMAYVYGNPEYYQGDDMYQKMQEENNHVLQAAKMHPSSVRPFFAVDPLKDIADKELKRCHQLNQNAGLKLHFNASQVYLTEPEHLSKVKGIMSAAAGYDIPILLHFDNWHPKFGERDMALLADSILSTIDPIELRIAHFGTSGGFNDKTKHFIDSFLEIRRQNRIPTKHTILLDISAVALDKDSEGVSKLSDGDFSILKTYIDLIGVDNIIFGSDYPLYTSDIYFDVLRNKLELTDQELSTMLQSNR